MNPRLRCTDRSCPAIQNKIAMKYLQESQNPPRIRKSSISLSFFPFSVDLEERRKVKTTLGFAPLQCIPPTPGDFLSIPQLKYSGAPKTEPGSPKLHQEDVHWQSHSHQWVISSPVLLIPHKSSAACWPRSDYFPLLKTSFLDPPCSELNLDPFYLFFFFLKSFLRQIWGEIL